MAKIDYFLDDEDIKDVDAGSTFLFDPPSDANIRGTLKDRQDPTENKYKATWVQTLEIVEAQMKSGEKVSDDDGNEYEALLIELVFQVPANAIRTKTGEADPNAGRQHRAWYRLVPGARKQKDHPKYRFNNFNTSRAMGVLRSIWGSGVFPSGVQANLGEYFSGDSPPVVGQTVTATFKQSKYDGKAKDELSDFVPLELRES